MEYAAGEREFAGQVLAQPPAQELAVVLESRQRDLADLAARKRRVGERGAHLALAYLDHLLVARVGLQRLGPRFEQLLCAGIERPRLDKGVDLGRFPAEHLPGRRELLALARELR